MYEILQLPKNLSIRPWREGDEVDLIYHANNHNVYSNLTDRFPHPYTAADARWWIEHTNNQSAFLSTIAPVQHRSSLKALEAQEYETSLYPRNFAICSRNAVIGCCGLEHESVEHRYTAVLGYWLGEEYWGQGIATLAVGSFVKWAFETFRWLLRIEASAWSWNIASSKVLKKIGLEFEGTSRMKAVRGTHVGDLFNYGIVRPDTEAWTRAYLQNLTETDS